jgi:hypothetical protein
MIEVDLGVVHHFSDGLYAKEMLLPAKHFAVSHAHAYDHLSILAKGDVTVEVEGVRTEYKAPACIHATQETDANKIDEVLIGG